MGTSVITVSQSPNKQIFNKKAQKRIFKLISRQQAQNIIAKQKKNEQKTKHNTEN